MKYHDLQKECKRRNLKANGTAEQLRNRLLGKDGKFLFTKFCFIGTPFALTIWLQMQISNQAISQIFLGPIATQGCFFERNLPKVIHLITLFGSSLLQKFGPVTSCFVSIPKLTFVTIYEATERPFAYKWNQFSSKMKLRSNITCFSDHIHNPT
jgi:hypothetical protein